MYTTIKDERERARLMAYTSMAERESCRDTDSLQCETKNTDAIISRKGHTRRTSAHTSCEISRNIELRARVELSDREGRERDRWTRRYFREATVRRIISDLKSLLHHFLPPVPLELILSCPSSVLSSSSSSLPSPSCSSLSFSSVLGVRLCFWLGSGVIGSPKPVLIIDPPAWQLPAKPLSTSCVPAKRSFRLCARDLPRSVSTEVRRAGRSFLSLWQNSVWRRDR